MRKGYVVGVFLLAAILVFPAFAAPDSFRFVVTGDSRGGDNGINSARLTELAAFIIAEQPDLVLFTGDLVANGTLAQLQYWVQVFMDPLLQHGVAVYPIRGNHDSNADAWRTVFSGVHAVPNNGPPSELGLTYSFVHKNALFVGLDVCDFMQVNQEWLDAQLAAKTVPHVFVYNHYPAFSVEHVDSLALFPDKRDAFWNSIGAAGGKVYFTGHDHFFDDAKAYDIHGIWIHQMVAGAAGAPLYDWGGAYLESPRVKGISHNKNNGYCLVDVTGNDVRTVFKQRVESQGDVQYPETDAVFTYSAWPQGQGLPVTSLGALIAMLLMLLFAGLRLLLA